VPVTERRTSIDWAQQVQALIDAPRYADAERITLVCDNLNTHDVSSFYQAFAPDVARRLRDRLERVFTPKHGSWLNVAECELSVLSRQCLNGRIPEQPQMQRATAAWTAQRNKNQTKVDWRFTTADVRIKVKRLYPKSQAWRGIR